MLHHAGQTNDDWRLTAMTEAASDGARLRQLFIASEVMRLVVNGLTYITTPYHRVTPLDPVAGAKVWNFEVSGSALPSLRGAECWARVNVRLCC
jgi:quinoprotein glucose dehydrogenase